MKELSFKIQGEFVCHLARSWFWDENREYEKCEELLLSCLMTDEISEEEKKKIVVEILEGRKILVGVNELELVEDGEQIRPLTDKFKEYQKKEMIQKIEEDIQRRPLAYLDPYSCDKNINEYKPVDNLVFDDERDVQEAFGRHLTPYQEVRLWAYSSENLWYHASRLLPGFWDEKERKYLDNGFYLIERPKLVYELIGGPVTDQNEEKLFALLKNHLKSLVNNGFATGEKAKEIIHRNMKYDAAMKEISQERQEQTEEKTNSDQLNRTTSPDDFLSEYGLIDPSGNYYSCSFAGHHTKAHYILKSREGKFYDFDEALDKLYSDGWAIIRNPDPGGSVFFDYRSDRRPTKRQIDTAFDHMIRFNERTLPGIKEYLENE